MLDFLIYSIVLCGEVRASENLCVLAIKKNIQGCLLSGYYMLAFNKYSSLIQQPIQNSLRVNASVCSVLRIKVCPIDPISKEQQHIQTMQFLPPPQL